MRGVGWGGEGWKKGGGGRGGLTLCSLCLINARRLRRKVDERKNKNKVMVAGILGGKMLKHSWE